MTQRVVDADLIRNLDSMLIDVHALLLQIEAAMGEIRLQDREFALREAGLQEIGGSMFDSPSPEGTTAYGFYPDAYIDEHGDRWEIVRA